jgi:hypothetical protein
MTNFDKHIKEQLGNTSPLVPSYIWENIMTERERRKPKGFWLTLFNTRNLFFATCIILAISATTWFFITPKSIQNKHTSGANTDQSITEPAGEPSNLNANSDKKNTTNNAVSLLNNDVQAIAPVQNNGISSPLTYPFSNNVVATSFYSADKNRLGTNHIKSRVNNSSSANSNADDNVWATVPDYYLPGKYLLNADKLPAIIIGTPALKSRSMASLTLPGCPTIEDDAAGNKKYFEIYGGPDLGIRSFSDTGNSSYLQRRKESAQFSSAFSAGIRYTKVFSNGMSLRTGINYSQINEKFKLTQGNIVQVTYIINAQGDTTGSYTVTGTRFKTTYNKYRTIDVPLVVGYELGNGKLHANINAGALINIYSWQKGDVLDPSGNPVNITTGKSKSTPYGFKTNLGVGFTGAVSVYYKLSDRLHLLAEPYYKHNFSPMNKDNLTLKQKYNTAGIKLGIRLDLQN